MLSTLLALCFFAGVAFAVWRRSSRKEEPKLPPGTKELPGPKGLPVIGCVHKLVPENPWMSFHNWGLEYGPIYNVNLAGSNHVWISDEKIAHDLLSKKGAIYSDRPHIPGLIHDNRTSGEYLPLMSKNDLWNRQRRFATTIMRTSQNAAFYGYPELEAKRLMKELLETPHQYNTHLESFISRVTCRLAWGTPVASDELKQRARELLLGVSPTGVLGNKLPFVMALPDWLSPAKAWERKRMRTEQHFFQVMQAEARNAIKSAKTLANTTCAPSSWTKMFFENVSNWGFRDELEGAYAVGMHGIAGALTIAAPMQGFCLAMCLYPKILPKLQEELDALCGNDRPPTFADMPKLPFLRACIRESLRWRPPVPTGIPHELIQDDVYGDYHIPAHTVVHPLEWSMSRNPEKYPKPDMYNPERWVDPAYPTYQEPLSKHPTICGYSQFGFGRRICQGQEVAEADLFVGIGALAWAFDIRKKIDPETGLEIPVPEMKYSELLIAKPKWFEFAITPRSEARRLRILELYEEEAALGEYQPSREYWDNRYCKVRNLGWGKV